MTAKQFLKKAEIARKTGMAYLDDGDRLYYTEELKIHGTVPCYTVTDRTGNTVTSSWDANKLTYLFN